MERYWRRDVFDKRGFFNICILSQLDLIFCESPILACHIISVAMTKTSRIINLFFYLNAISAEFSWLKLSLVDSIRISLLINLFSRFSHN